MKKASMLLSAAAVFAGALGGLLSLFLILRLNPQISITAWTFFVGLSLWMSWGSLILGLPFWLLSLLSRNFFARRGASIGDACAILLGLVYFAAGLLFWVNAVIHPEFVSRTIQRQLRQDSAIWFGATILVFLFWRVWRRRERHPTVTSFLLALVFLLPALRLFEVPLLPATLEKIPSTPLSAEGRKILVCGVEGLDFSIFQAQPAGRSLHWIPELKKAGSFGKLRAFRPFLRPALWTTVVTGVLPRRHGVTSAPVWQLPLLAPGELRLLPWTPNGSRLFLPWGLGRQTGPFPSAVPPIWRLISGKSGDALVMSWPGFSPELAGEVEGLGDPELKQHIDEFQVVLENSFPAKTKRVLAALREDSLRVARAKTALSHSEKPVFLILSSLALCRRLLEPQGPGEARRREALGIVLEFVDSAIGGLRASAGSSTPVVLLSPYGMAPPNSYERLKRLLGSGEHWRASAIGAPDGLLILSGPGIRSGEEFPRVRMEDVAPTLCYILDLPIPQHMEGRVILKAIDPGWSAAHTLRVRDLRARE